jgi:hypothetical protein
MLPEKVHGIHPDLTNNQRNNHLHQIHSDRTDQEIIDRKLTLKILIVKR